MIKVSVSPGEFVQGRATDLDVVFTNTAPGVCSNIVFRLSLPPAIRLLRGNELIQLPRIDAGESLSHRIQVRADAPGRWRLGTTNFSYRDPQDDSVREPGVSLDVTVGPAMPTAGSADADLVVRLDRAEIAHDEWTTVRCHVENAGRTQLRDVCVLVDGSLDVREKGTPHRVAALGPAEHEIIVLHCRARGSASRASIEVMTSYSSDKGIRGRRQDTITLRVRKPRSGHLDGDTARASRSKILYLAANPLDTGPLRVDHEFRDIADALERGEFRDRFELVPSFAVRVVDISREVIRHSPQVIHFAGHGGVDGGLYAEDEMGNSFPLDRDTVVGLVRLAEAVECVLINACDTNELAEALAEHVDYVIGMRHKIGDKAAVGFSVGFYQGIAANRPIEAAFDSGRAVLRAHCQTMREMESPFLLMRGQSLPSMTDDF